MIRLLVGLLLLLAPAVQAQRAAAPATAHAPAAPTTPSATTTPAAAAPATTTPATTTPATTTPVLTPAQAQQALDVLNDPAKRAQTIEILQSLARVAPAPAVTPDSLGAQLVVGASHRLGQLSDDTLTAVRTLTDFPLLWGFVRQLARDPAAQAQLLDTLWRLVLTMAIALAAQALVRRLLRRPAEALAAHARAARSDPLPAAVAGIAAAEEGHTEVPPRVQPVQRAIRLLRRLPFALARLLLDLLPVLALLGAGAGALAVGLGNSQVARTVIVAVLQAYAGCRIATSLTRMLLGPGRPRLIPVTEATATGVLAWVRRIAAIALFGSALAEIGLLFGMYQLAHDALLKLVALVVHLCGIVIVLETRGPVAAWIRGGSADGTNRGGGTLPRLRRLLADVWHIVAIIYLVALWLVWALDVPGGFTELLRLTVVTAVVLAVARLVSKLALGTLRRASQVGPDLAERYPGLEDRLTSYYPLAQLAVKCVIAGLTTVALVQAWGWDALAWFTGGALGGRLVSSLAVVALTLGTGAVVWEASNAAIQRHLDKLVREQQYARSARLRTLLPMLRTALLITILAFAGLMALSEVGVNIAPLLAGASVVGLAVGFGSQKLVQDIITGLFLLLENTMQVGDVVTLGGLSGTVEALSVRTIRLRALDGSVHIIPFSAVTTVTNATRDYGFAVLDVPIGLNEEPDHIADVLREIARDMRAEPRWGAAIQDDLDVMGVEKFLDTAWLMRARVKTVPSQRWAVGRELNRRIKYRFDADAIESPLTSYRSLHQQRPNFVALPDPPAPASPA